MQARTGWAAGAGRVDRAGRDDESRSCGSRRRAGDRASVVAPVAGGQRAGARVARVFALAASAAEQLPVAAERRGRTADPRRAGPDELRAGPVGGARRLPPLDDPQGAGPSRLLAASPSGRAAAVAAL